MQNTDFMNNNYYRKDIKGIQKGASFALKGFHHRHSHINKKANKIKYHEDVIRKIQQKKKKSNTTIVE